MTLVIIILHILIDGIFGMAILRILGTSRLDLFEIAKAMALGFFAETMLLGILHFFGIPLLIGLAIFALIGIALFLYQNTRSGLPLRWHEPLFKQRVSIWEIGLLLLIGEKVIWSFLNLIKLPVYFDDALNHWSGRGKALLGGTNWSWDPESVYFLGRTFGHMEYPLMISIWRAANTGLLGSANGASERADGLIIWFIIAITATTWIFHLTKKRWLGLSGAFIITAMPLEAWHMTAGYAEILIQCYLLLAFWAMFNNKFILAGIFSAAMIWSKNEGLILFIPCVIFCLAIYLLLDKEKSAKEKVKAMAIFNVTWILSIAPWLIFKFMTGVGLTIPGKNELGYVPGALSKMAYALFDAPSSSILWLFIALGLVVSVGKIIKDKTLLILTIGCMTLLVMMIFVFTSTGAYIFLENQMTIHRSLLQIAPLFIITIVVALGNKEQKIVTQEVSDAY